MFIPETVDFGRLAQSTHSLLTHDPTFLRTRGNGKTLAYMYLMLGEYWLGEQGNSYIYVGENQHVSRMVGASFAELLEQEGVELGLKRNTAVSAELIVLKDKNMRFMFVGVNRFCEQSFYAGRRASRIFFDVTPRKQHELDQLTKGDLYQAQTHFTYSGIEII